MKTAHDHHQHIGPAKGVRIVYRGDSGIDDLERKVKEVIDKERTDQRTGPDHVPAGECVAEMVRNGIGLWFCLLILKRNHDAKIDMEAEHRSHEQADHPEHDRQGVQSSGIGIEVAEVNGGIAEQMDDDEQEHHLAGECHQDLSADCGGGEHDRLLPQ